ncbi:hypothetical protein EGT74_17475 [Chitinophaga lutea]|uniref:Uncharacterized protein n=1 Tax=Chitinophaga lutea TaxID=2488634 RepID=A0A3N4PQ22_9BACT|nr:hypothetical protein [Chitinophaga lutea]RPE08819.1 hypothetical protein EGT74_17475 [Chitinophaga lutea]
MLRNVFHIFLLIGLSLLLMVQPDHQYRMVCPEADGDAAEKTEYRVETSARAARYLAAVAAVTDTQAPVFRDEFHPLPDSWYRPAYYSFLHRFSLF